jgi:methylmalonyl-CoA mutase
METFSAGLNALRKPLSSTAVPLRFVTAASLFDGHDAAIGVMRRLIQTRGAEVVHLGHNRSVEDIVRAAVQEDADAIAVSSYQGGHLEFFSYMIDMLRERGAPHIRVFGGGGGTITQDEIAHLERYGVERIYHPNDGMRLGLMGMIDDLLERTHRAVRDRGARDGAVRAVSSLEAGLDDEMAIGRALSLIEAARIIEGPGRDGREGPTRLGELPTPTSPTGHPPVIGITGTGGAGKSSLVDELLLRFLQAFAEMRIAVLAIDPSRRRSGGALLGDRIRLNALRSKRVFMRSMATRRQNAATTDMLSGCLRYLKSLAFDLIMVETAGIGQGDSAIFDAVDFSVYVMTSDYGAPSQLEKIDMLDFADLVVLNKFDKSGGADALRDVRKQWKRNHPAFNLNDEDVHVYSTIASQFNDPGVTRMFVDLCRLLREKLELPVDRWAPSIGAAVGESRATALIPLNRTRYLAEIAEQGRAIRLDIDRQVTASARAHACWIALGEIGDTRRPKALESFDAADLTPGDDSTLGTLRRRYQAALSELSTEARQLLGQWPARRQAVTDPEYSYEVRGRRVAGSNYVESLSHNKIPKIAAPRSEAWSELLRFLMTDNLPGGYPYTAGVYPYRRDGEDPTRMFAGEGTPERTNRRFHYLATGQKATRLSTAFDSVTLYGEDPDVRPDIFGKIGNSGVSIATLDDMKKLYSGFDLSDPTTSVSMTINGPAPILLAMFMNTAIDQAVETHLREDSARWSAAQAAIATREAARHGAAYEGELPIGNNGLGLTLLGTTGDQLLDRETYESIKADTMRRVRGTVQADILKEDQAQNTCIFSTEFALRMMGDVQQYFIDHEIRNFYSVSISGYHIAEAGANPISQLAFTLANGFTIIEYYLARGMKIDDFAPNLSFFFSNGMDAEYSVIGRVARRIWARAVRERYHGGPRSQMLKYHIQTSGRSLHAQEIRFNDIRTTLQALYALFDNCNSLHTNAFDEAITTPTEESVRRAVAIQLIINRELGLNMCENPWQGSFIVDQLTDLVEEAVYKEFEAISERGGVLGAMDAMYQRGKIQEESLYYEQRKHDGSLPLIGVNTFLRKEATDHLPTELELIRSTETEKRAQIVNLEAFKDARNHLPLERGRNAPGTLLHLQQAARERHNTFGSLMEAVKFNTLGQISHALYEVGGEYRRNM